MNTGTEWACWIELRLWIGRMWLCFKTDLHSSWMWFEATCHRFEASNYRQLSIANYCLMLMKIAATSGFTIWKKQRSCTYDKFISKILTGLGKNWSHGIMYNMLNNVIIGGKCDGDHLVASYSATLVSGVNAKGSLCNCNSILKSS